MTQLTEKYRIDKNLQCLQYASLHTLKKIFLQYRFFTHYYISDLAILISKLPHSKLKSVLAEILYEELGSGREIDAHPTLYDNFLLSIGIQKEELAAADNECLNILNTIQLSLSKNSWAYAIGLRGMGGECLCQIYLSTMHEYFSKNLSIVDIQDKIAWKFWLIHIGEADLHHQAIVRHAIDELLTDMPEIGNDLLNGYLESKLAWDSFWTKIFKVAGHTQEQGGIYEAVTSK